MEFATFADHCVTIEEESADLEITALLADLCVAAGSEDGRDSDRDLECVVRFVQGRVFPAWDARKLDIGPRTCYEAIARAAGPNVDADAVEREVAEVGEVGTVAAGYEFGGQQGLGAFGVGGGHESHTVGAVFDTLERLAHTDGDGSHDTKVDLLFSLFNRASPTEARYLARLVLGEMRIGVGEGTVRDAIAAAFSVPVETVERAVQVTNDYGHVAVVAHEDGSDGLEGLSLEVGRPVQAMLAQAGTVTDALEAWDRVAVEWKFDGARVQVHHVPGELTLVFSRNMEDVTDALPEVVETVESTLECPAILDGEVVAVDDDGSPLAFQEVLRRFRRKHDVEKAREAVTVRPVFFDCLHADGEDLLETPLETRHDRMEAVLGGSTGEYSDVSTGEQPNWDEADAATTSHACGQLWLTDDPDRIEAIDARALEAGHEGIMLKDPTSTYTPGRRGQHWLKRKPDVDTLDCVVTGAEWGEGRRATYLGTFVISVTDGDDYLPIGKVATGITDETLVELTELLEPHIVAEDGKTVDIEPAVVFEVGYEEIQPSPTYESGFALRFPRFVSVRSDTDLEGVDSLERVKRLHDR